MGNTLCKSDGGPCCAGDDANNIDINKSSALTIADERKYLP